MVKYTDLEIQVAKNALVSGFHWITSDADGSLFVYTEKPYKNESRWGSTHLWCHLCDTMVPIFKDITWWDNEPTRLEDILHPQILDNTERRYLKSALRPLPKIKTISKCSYGDSLGEYLLVKFVNNHDVMVFPSFPEGTMYKGMELEKVYTPEELGLDL